MTSVPDRARVRLTGISSRAYEHPADRSALVALRKLSGFDVLLSKLFGLINERALRLTFLAGAVKVSERQFPHIYALVRDGAYILDLADVPEVYVVQSPLVNAMAIGRDRPFIVVTTGLVNLHDEEELRWVIGHELGHILSGHAVYRTMLLILIQLAARIAWMPIGYLGLRAIIWGLEEWFRKSELSCDRAGLLAGQDVDAARRALMKLAGGPQLSELNPDAFREQAHEYDAVPDLRDSDAQAAAAAGQHAPVRRRPVRRARPLGDERRRTSGSSAATTRGAPPTGTPRSAKRSATPPSPTRTRGAGRRTRWPASSAASPRPRPGRAAACSTASPAAPTVAATAAPAAARERRHRERRQLAGRSATARCGLASVRRWRHWRPGNGGRPLSGKRITRSSRWMTSRSYSWPSLLDSQRVERPIRPGISFAS